MTGGSFIFLSKLTKREKNTSQSFSFQDIEHQLESQCSLRQEAKEVCPTIVSAGCLEGFQAA
jgi:hypothetical protein